MAKLTILTIGPPETYGEPQRLSRPDAKKLMRSLPNTKQFSEDSMRAIRIFIARRLLRFSGRCASFAMWMAPELKAK